MVKFKYLSEIVDLSLKDRPMSVAYDREKLDTKFNKKLINAARGQDTDNKMGMFGYGRTNPKDPHEFLKKTRINNLSNDGYYQYVKAIAPIMKSNPFVPRVYQMVLTKDINGAQIPSYKMESLLSSSDVSINQIKSAINSIDPRIFKVCERKRHKFHADQNEEQERQRLHAEQQHHDFFNKFFKQGNTFKKKRYTSEEMCDAVAEVLKDVIDKKPNAVINNPELNQVLDIVKNLLNTNDEFRLDLHGGNIMFRLTSFGVQLVITDPIA